MSELTARISAPMTFSTNEGEIIFEDSRIGAITVVCIPGLGDTRGQFRFLAPKLVEHGYRVIVVDPRGQGDSAVGFAGYSASAVGDDIADLITSKKLKNVILIGSSSGGASAAWAAAKVPTEIRGLVLLAAFLRDHPRNEFQSMLLKVALTGSWGPGIWAQYYTSLYKTAAPSDLAEYAKRLKSSLQRKGYLSALRQMIFNSKSDVELKLDQVKCRVLALAGSRDPDFKDPQAELRWITERTRAETQLIEGAGHYPHLECPDEVLQTIVRFIGGDHAK